MRFSIEQVFLTDAGGKPLSEPSPAAYHVVEAETLDVALAQFFAEQQASVVGEVQRFPGAQAVATAQQRGTVFTIHVAPGTGSFRRRRPFIATDATKEPADRLQPRNESSPDELPWMK